MGDYPVGYRWLSHKGVRSILGDLDTEVMATVWAQAQGHAVTMTEVFESLHQHWRGFRQSRTIGAMGRLARKGLLRVESRYGRSSYHATCTEDELLSSFLRLLQENLARPLPDIASPNQGSPSESQDFLRTQVREILDQITQRQLPQ